MIPKNNKNRNGMIIIMVNKPSSKLSLTAVGSLGTFDTVEEVEGAVMLCDILAVPAINNEISKPNSILFSQR